MKYDSFDNKYFPKKDGIFLVMFNRIIVVNYTGDFKPYSIARRFWVAATFLKTQL
jgi:hypothetical protein